MLPKVVYVQTFSVNAKAAMTMFVLGARIGLQTTNTCREILSRNKFIFCLFLTFPDVARHVSSKIVAAQ